MVEHRACSAMAWQPVPALPAPQGVLHCALPADPMTVGCSAAAAAPSHCPQVTTKYFRGWEMPAQLARVKAYIDAFTARPSWQHTLYSPEAIIAGWERHGVKRVV